VLAPIYSRDAGSAVNLRDPGGDLPGADADANAGDHNYLALAKPNVIMNGIRLRRLAVFSVEREPEPVFRPIKRAPRW
jgi:hypothetical protein